MCRNLSSDRAHSNPTTHRHWHNSAPDVCPGKSFDTAGAAPVRVVFAAHPHGCISYTGDISHWKDRRKGQRSTALVCSAIGYLCGFLWSILTPCSWLVHILIPLLCHFHRSTADSQSPFSGCNASGHACSTTAPVFLLTWKLHPLFIIPSVLLIAAVYRSSSKLSRHTLPQLLIGSAVSLLACGISLLTYGLG